MVSKKIASAALAAAMSVNSAVTSALNALNPGFSLAPNIPRV